MSEIYNDKSIYDDALTSALLEIKPSIDYSCDKFENHSIMECLYCRNCYFRIIFDSEEGITTFPSDYSKDDIEQYEILFYDRVPSTDEVYSYLFDNDSCFIINRLEDDVIMVDKLNKPQKTYFKTPLKKRII